MHPTAELIAQHFIADGFAEGGVPEVERLAAACDRLLTRQGMSLEIVCIVDREHDTARHFTADPLVLQEIARSCFKYLSSVVYGYKMPCTIRVLEIGPDATTPENHRGLESLSRAARELGTFFFSGWALDPARAAVWSTHPLNGLLAGRRKLERLLRDPKPPTPRAAVTFRKRFPVATALVIGWLVLVFAVEASTAHLSATKGIDLATLVALGGESRTLVLSSGEWHRIFTAALLHGDALHLLVNCIALYLAGAFVERLVGWTWLFALLLAGTIGGAALSLSLNPPDTISVGASSAIMGLLAAGLVLSGRLAAGKQRALARNNLARFLVPSLIPLVTAPHINGRIDYAGHLGGAIAGAAAGAALLFLWRGAEPRPPKKLGRVLAAASVVVFVIAVAGVGALYAGYARIGDIAPDSAFASFESNPEVVAAHLMREFPRDPRSHWLRGQQLASQGKYPDAEKELRIALADRDALEVLFKPQLEHSIRSDLARVLMAEKKADEARREAERVCGTPDGELLAGTDLCKSK